MRKRTVVGGVTVAVLVAGAAGAGLWWRHTEQEKEADRAAQSEVSAFAQAWQKRSFTDPALRFSGSTAAAVGTSFTTTTNGLGSGPVSVTATPTRRSGDSAKSTLHVTWSLAGGVPWSYDVPVTSRRVGDSW